MLCGAAYLEGSPLDSHTSYIPGCSKTHACCAANCIDFSYSILHSLIILNPFFISITLTYIFFLQRPFFFLTKNCHFFPGLNLLSKFLNSSSISVFASSLGYLGSPLVATYIHYNPSGSKPLKQYCNIPVPKSR